MTAPPAWLRHTAAGLVLSLHVQPGARRTRVLGEHGGRLKIALQAPPVDGRANEALLRFLRQQLGLQRAELRLISGAGARDKAVAIDAAAERGQEIAGRLCALAAPG